MAETVKILVVDDKASMRSLLEVALSDHGYEVRSASDGVEAVDMLADDRFDIVITDLKMPGLSGLEVLKQAKAQSVATEVIVVTAFGTMETAIEAMRLGACDFVTKPFQLAEIERKIDAILELREVPDDDVPEGASQHAIVGKSQHTRDLLAMIAKVGPSQSSVLITGPTGTGKELVARALHDASPRSDMPFVALNCAALAPGILESELFGHEKGAFTGADAQRIGRFEQAHGGTLFLDEAGDIDPAIQTKLLRVLQEGVIERVGGVESINVDVRVITATNRDLKKAMEEGSFREDFYYRINVFSIEVSPLFERKEDIPALVDLFIQRYAPLPTRNVIRVEKATIERLMNYSWPGNVRQLENVLERAIVLCSKDLITPGDLPDDLVDEGEPLATDAVKKKKSGSDSSLRLRTADMEAQLIRQALEKFRWNKTRAAEELGIKRTTLQYKIKKYGIT